MKINEIKKKLSKMLEEKRYIHSLAVADIAAHLAKIYNVNEERAYIAGLLHDCAKNIKPNEYEKYKIHTANITDYELLHKKATGVLHSFVGRQVARNVFYIEDREILDAIAFHTVGRINMTTLDKIIYIADIIDPNRIFSDITKVKQSVEIDLDLALVSAIKHKMNYLLRKKRYLYKKSIDTWDAILSKHSKNGEYKENK